SVSVDGKEQSGNIPNLVLDSYEKANITINYQIPQDASVNASQDFSFIIDSLTSSQQKTYKSKINVIESRPPGFIMEIEEPDNMDLMAGDELTLKIKVTPDPYVNDDVVLSLKGEVSELETFNFEPESGKAPLESTFSFSFKEKTQDKKVNLMIEAKSGTITKTQVVTVNVLRNPDAVPPVLDIVFPSKECITNKSEITVTGMTDAQAILTINGNEVQKEKNGSFEQKVTLTEGMNEITVIAKNRKGLETRVVLNVELDTVLPILEIETEIPEETCKREITIKGKTETNCVVKIGNQDLVLDKEGRFEATVALEHGWNGIEITSSDNAFNEAIKSYDVIVVNIVKLRIGDQKASVNEEEVTLDVAPYIKNDRTMVPIRFIAEALGAEVGWENATKSITITKDDITISIKIGSVEALIKEEGVIGREKIILEAAPEIVSGRTFVPLRFVSEAIGASIDWNSELKEITIKQ
ncbi:MAG: copper amine oxidase N-terminal domain-containing protein, partial [Caldisericia bacterium]|nr:copper amine oxidase N-terminal domain-containing protein [Caldisericia bacterium]